ncbi:hypothetical protein N4G62_04620 [Sphingomonas sanguinis]|uniref:Uncharacterized protein n=1 Tax=Sphingomonas sanguinis TaxID=33051 RepID=A0ABU5LN07_9SPHN|nr:hypothetical protein [Sphingomonas sanguinis]MDZ7281311.1 hypothetical protein [Sphingomonas sanguinis]
MAKPVLLLAAQINFAADYIASVLKKRDIWVIGPLDDLSQAIRVLLTEDIRAAILIGVFPAQDRSRLIEMLNLRALPHLTVRHAEQDDPEENGAVLIPPFAAYQVADWVEKHT